MAKEDTSSADDTTIVVKVPASKKKLSFSHLVGTKGGGDSVPAVVGDELTVAHLMDHVEIEPDYLKFMYGCWVKLVHKESNKYSSGGIVTRIEGDVLYLRHLRSKEHISVDIPSHYIYCKRTSEHYKAVTEIAQERAKLNHERKQLESERKQLEQNKNFLLRQYYYSAHG